MQRRNLLKSIGLGVSTAALGGASVESVGASGAGTIDPLAFDSTSSLLNTNIEPVTGDPDWVVVNAESTAFNSDEDDGDRDGSYDFIEYPDGESIPLVGAEDGVVGVGAPIVQDGTGFESAGNEEFVLNVLDAEAGPGTVLWDEGHGQFYDLGRHLSFEGYAENNGYDIVGTEDLASDLAADDVTAAVVTTPSIAFTDDELDAIASFVDEGGALLLFHQSDFGDFDQPHNLNDVAEAAGAPFRFNDDQVADFANNAGIFFVPQTDEFDTSFPYFSDRPGIAPPELEVGRRYPADVVDVADGDTVDIQFQNGYVDEVRVLGIDTPETFADPELPAEWEGIDDLDYLIENGNAASEFAVEELAGESVEIFFDTEEPFRGGFGRLLAYVDYDADGDGQLDTLYNRKAVAEGYARVYDSGLAKHDEFLEVERKAKQQDLGVWSGSDPDATTPDRPERVEDVYVPAAAPVEGTDDRHVDVVARADDTASDPGVPLAAVDERAGVAVVGGELLDEDYEESDTPVDDPTAYDEYQFTAGLIERLTNRAGDVLIDGGHGQFASETAVGAEDAAFFQRYLEGLDWGFTQYNDLSMRKLAGGRAIVVAPATESFTDADVRLLRSYAKGGGAVIVLGEATAADADAPEQLGADYDPGVANDLLARLGTSLRLGTDLVSDPTNNAGAPYLPLATDVSIEPPAHDENEGE